MHRNCTGFEGKNENSLMVCCLTCDVRQQISKVHGNLFLTNMLRHQLWLSKVSGSCFQVMFRLDSKTRSVE